MGMFLSLSGVIGRTQEQVRDSLTKYASMVDGGLQEADLTTNDTNCCVIEQSHNNTTVFYPYNYVEWEKSSEFISRELNAPVFSFHIHDGDLWMYVLYVNGQIVDQFNPIPEYWDENLSDEEIQSWKGDASVVAKYIAQPPGTIANYLTRWHLDAELSEKAYDDDEFGCEDWQLLDFMKKCGLPYPLDEDGNAKGKIYKLWTKELPLSNSSNVTAANRTNVTQNQKPWWKFWE
jgi:hypothetical protein